MAEGCRNIVARVREAYIELPLPVFRVIDFMLGFTGLTGFKFQKWLVFEGKN